VLRLPLGLVGATESGPLTQTLASGRLRLLNGETGQPIRMRLPADEGFIAAGRDRVIWSGSDSKLHVTDLRTGADVVIARPGAGSPSETYPPSAAAFDPRARHLILLLDRVDAAGHATAEDLFVADTATRTRQAARWRCRLPDLASGRTRSAGLGPPRAGNESGVLRGPSAHSRPGSAAC